MNHRVSVSARGLTKHVGRNVPVLQDVSLSLAGGELVAVVGGSGAGKTTLLEALAGVAPADAGRVMFDGIDVYRDRELVRSVLGYVPQDDIIHTDLPLERTLHYAARLRLDPRLESTEVEERMRHALATLALEEHAGTVVASLSGGQRKRASIAVEMLSEPRVFFLDEPTSGLDPATAADLLRTLRGLADRGTTVLFTTHAVQDLTLCDRVVFLARGGRLAFVGSVAEACRHFGVSSPDRIYERIDSAPARPPDDVGVEVVETRRAWERSRLPGALRQWWALSTRTFETLVRNKLTLAILLGAPAMVVAMFAVLFRPDAFDPTHPDPTSILMIIFWITFGSFFFGLTYGLLQIVTECSILRREYLVGLRLGPYLLSKIAVLLPFLVVVNVLMLVGLRALDRLPPASLRTYGSLAVTLALCALAALALGLLASAGVENPSQATLALPMLCFPAVLFSGAILPVHVMAQAGRWISVIVPVRWAFEAVGRDLRVRDLLLGGSSPLGPPLVESYGNAGTSAIGLYWSYLIGFALLFLLCASAMLRRKMRRR
ncbi:MAG TPA: ATP-binding cassette domain-containing protein [Actinomycetota bacterium]|nr:ATP-binding cassette domain-containing protein [Actinomycetota bacterium]